MDSPAVTLLNAVRVHQKAAQINTIFLGRINKSIATIKSITPIMGIISMASFLLIPKDVSKIIHEGLTRSAYKPCPV